MKVILVAAGVAVVVSVGMLAAGSEMCFGDGERISGNNKICFYNCPSGRAAITVASYALCPLNITR